MSETVLQISLDSTSTFDALVSLRDQLAAAGGDDATFEADLAEDTPSAVIFGLGQLLCAAVREGKVKSDAVLTLKELAPFGAMCATTGFDNALAQAA
ncbi:MAG: hypothetical protein VX083_13775 [Pseudomonadota bacterium]|jgi:hypothetical protein|uniref:STAS domain-containing protein n=1 Tax=Thalassovita autumnalis TaxID=2072972 RepID=A0A0N7LX77_9RHOB|nr:MULTISPECIES: hypothetical protein [Thalassovita]MEC7964011.1 hypothetical protein [Pseudomonadota bacterium]MEC8040136.1 hypothetical protein [Pseudomonadota bacterium]MEC8294555.1 hypothetical protein [Pseudomonadota bacterium]CUH65034.1 hypothetical protein TL5118_01119 [Thalassovita autumnalis]CUH71135.1 hypothetical protein TL5120_00916 [Thalassovita autumnalis]